MAFKLKSMAFPIELTPNDPNQGENYKILGFALWVWVWPSKHVFAFFIFLRSLMPKKFIGLQEIIYLSCISPQKIAKDDHPIRFIVT